MPREVVMCAVGGCGVHMAAKTMALTSDEHGLSATGGYAGDSDQQLDHIDVLFKETSSGRYIPRVTFNDLDPAACDTVRAGPHGGLFAPDRFTVGKSGAKNNWAKGHYSEGAEIVDKVVDSLRTEIEACDCAQGIQLFHSTGGGTGAGLGTLTIAKIREEFPDRVMSTFSVVPSAKVSDVVVEPYNAILTSQHLIENSDMTFLFDNEAAYGICTETLGLATPTYGDLNYITASAINGLTAGMRYPGLLNSDLRKLCVNLVPFPRLHFMCLSFAPLMPHGLADYKEMSVREMIPSLFSGTSRLGGGSIQYGKTLTAAALFRGGSVSAQEVDEEMVNVQNKLSSRFVEWIGSNCSTSMCYVPPKGFKTSALLVDNSTGTQEVFKREAERFTALFRRKAFLHWYTNEGMDEMEFTEAESSVNDIVSELQQYQDCSAEEEGRSEDKEEG